MRARLVGLAAVLLGVGFAGAARAQDANGGFSDPFFLYYGFYLPRQSAMAAQPQPEDFYRAQAVQRQYSAQTDRAGLYDPLSAVGLDELDPLKPFGSRSGSTRMVRTVATGLPTTLTSSNSPGAPMGYFGRVGSYYPHRTSGRGRPRAGGGGSAAAVPTALGQRSFVPSPRQGMVVPGTR